MRKSELSKALKQYITEHSGYGWRLKGNKVMFATGIYHHKAYDFTDEQGTIEDWQFELDYIMNKAS